MVYKGPFDARPKDDIGLGIARIHVNDDVKKRQRLVNQVNGIDDVVYKGPFDARPKDDIGLGIARIHVNDDVKKRQRLVNQVNGIDDG